MSQHKFIADSNGDLIVDYIGRFENLDSDFRKVCMTLGVRIERLPRLMASNKQASHADCYSRATWELVRERYADDIELFDYGRVCYTG